VEWIHQLDVKFVEGDLGGLVEPSDHGDSPHEVTADAEDRADHHLVLGARAGYPAQGVLRLTDQLPHLLIERVAGEVATQPVQPGPRNLSPVRDQDAESS